MAAAVNFVEFKGLNKEKKLQVNGLLLNLTPSFSNQNSIERLQKLFVLSKNYIYAFNMSAVYNIFSIQVSSVQIYINSIFLKS